MWTTVNALQMIYFTLAMELYHTLYVHVMFSFLAFINMENPLIANGFIFTIDFDLLNSEPINNRFEKIDIFCFFYFLLFPSSSVYQILNFMHVSNLSLSSSMQLKFLARVYSRASFLYFYGCAKIQSKNAVANCNKCAQNSNLCVVVQIS